MKGRSGSTRPRPARLSPDQPAHEPASPRAHEQSQAEDGQGAGGTSQGRLVKRVKLAPELAKRECGETRGARHACERNAWRALRLEAHALCASVALGPDTETRLRCAARVQMSRYARATLASPTNYLLALSLWAAAKPRRAEAYQQTVCMYVRGATRTPRRDGAMGRDGARSNVAARCLRADADT